MDRNINSGDLEAMSENIINQSINLNTRYKLVFNWLPDRVSKLLDAGCAWGYGTQILKNKTDITYGLDPTEESIQIAQKQDHEKSIIFVRSFLEKTPFDSNLFDVVVCCETIEHVNSEVDSLNEVFRILKPGGILIMTTPHKGLFGFMDTGNSIRWVEYIIKSKLSGLYKVAYKIRKGEYPKAIEYTKPIYNHDNTHRHYSLEDIIQMLESSFFREKYDILKVFRSGFFIEPFTLNLEFYLLLFNIPKSIVNKISKPLRFLSELEYWIPYNIFAYNIAVKIRKSDGK